MEQDVAASERPCLIGVTREELAAPCQHTLPDLIDGQLVEDAQPLFARRGIVIRTQEPEAPRAIVVDESIDGGREGSGLSGHPSIVARPG